MKSLLFVCARNVYLIDTLLTNTFLDKIYDVISKYGEELSRHMRNMLVLVLIDENNELKPYYKSNI
jgi:hypothetical protein